MDENDQNGESPLPFEYDKPELPGDLPLCEKCHDVYVDYDELHCGRCAFKFGLPRKKPVLGKACQSCGKGGLSRRQVYCPKCNKERRRASYRESKRKIRSHNVHKLGFVSP